MDAATIRSVFAAPLCVAALATVCPGCGGDAPPDAAEDGLAPAPEGVVCEDGLCRLPPAAGGEAAEAPAFAVLSPVPRAAVRPAPLAPRLDSLDGKTIALVGGSFMAGVTHPEIRRRLLAATRPPRTGAASPPPRARRRRPSRRGSRDSSARARSRPSRRWRRAAPRSS